ncbi:MAG: Flp pilus assembly complex ATPase component TadA [Candidatus Omnitrophica bacterium]|nr:Flp pilus assembly complex ATPase component TadA [Candidatus Omnitrophota bacterium]
MSNDRLGHILLRQGLIDRQKLDFCLNIQRNNGGERIGRVLKHYDFINEEHIAGSLAVQAGWEMHRGDYKPDEDMIALFGLPFLMEKMIYPASTQNGTVFILSRTDDMAATDAIQARLNARAQLRIAPEWRLRQALETLAAREMGPKTKYALAEDNLADWLDGTFNLAIARGATDIHIEPSPKAVEIRLRIDGILCFLDSLRLEHLPRLANIIFHKAQVTVSDFRHFHDARFSHMYLDRWVDIRVSHIPSVNGPSLVLRLLDKAKAAMALTELGYGQRQWESIQTNLMRPQGITLIAGPTGCGKTTTLYAMLNHLKSITRKIVAIEDPVEMHLPLMIQVQTNDKRGISFGHAVRSFLRHDPDVILIGEIRDRETAQEALRAAMTGHKVLATLHANRPADAILRLNDLGVPYTHMAGNLSMVITQRLLRRLCPRCKSGRPVVKIQLLPYEHKYIEKEGQVIFEPRSCAQCHAGFQGRTAAAEVLSIDQDLGALIGKGDIMGLQERLSQNTEYITLFDDARRLIKQGVSSIQESVRVLG